tara:strand:+ start:1384 stop:1605 length:222 start_codon:yes stop_codon:yes gene_type:complete
VVHVLKAPLSPFIPIRVIIKVIIVMLLWFPLIVILMAKCKSVTLKMMRRLIHLWKQTKSKVLKQVGLKREKRI